MKRICFLFILAALSCSQMSAQTWQNTVSTPGTDLHWQGLANSAGYITVGQTTGWSTTTTSNSNIIVTQFDNNGNVLWAKTVSMTTTASTLNYRFEPRDISVAPAFTDPTTGVFMASGYYITGVAQNTSPNIGTNMFVLRIDANANVAWLRLNVLPTLAITQSEGIAVVTISSGDVIAVGNVLMANNAGAAPQTQIIAARLSPTGNVLWSNMYFNISTVTNSMASMVAHEATLAPSQNSCSPTVPPITESGVVLTGEITNHPNLANFGAGPHLFAMSIDATGTECWRNAYPVSPTTPSTTERLSAGHDITYESTTGNYIIVGRAYTNGISGAQNMTYIVRTTVAGAFVCGSIINIIGTSGGTTTINNAFARSVVAVNTAGTVGGIMVAGIDITTNASYLMSIPTTSVCPQNPTWVREYLLPPAPAPTAVWTPVAGISGNGVPESLVLTGTSPNTYNYFMTTNTINNAAGSTFDMHVIRTDASGNTLTPCPAVLREDSQYSTGMLIDLAEMQQVDNSWTSPIATSTAIILQQNLCSANSNVCTVTAAFTPLAATASCAYTFSNTSTGNGVLTYSWNFGDPASGANNTSNLAVPNHTFSASGVYNVCLTVTNTLPNGTTCANTSCQTIQVYCPTICTVASDYCYTTNGYQVTFNNLSTGNGTLSYTWSFGDGSASTAANPVKTYGAPGTYTICLTVINTQSNGTQCCSTCCKTITINPVCSVNSNFRYCVNGSQVALTNLSTTGVSYAWYLDNNTTTFSTAYTPATQVLSVGTHTVCLEATRNTTTGSCSKFTCKTITIDPTCSALARFSYTACLNSLSATFNNSSIGASSYSWNFGDPASGVNNTSSAVSPSHTFSSYGSYVVCLTAQSSATCRYRFCQTVQISQPNCSTNCPTIGGGPANKNNIDNGGEDRLNDGSDIQVFPNPAKDAIQVIYNSGDSAATLLKVTDIQGKVMREITLDPEQHALSIDLSAVPKGMYIIAIHHENGTISGAKLVKE